ncbi:hypothetical protein K503DRAFT_798357 [Rhizopogon vinicolor AM-OR11-026]|uniref:Uncharacterized protein n=1 Tax=Rhizopogon vinicolor AM-OR11-026 TaxID=1314800 RepID=A0A1B7N807_9AGAM|nr:hypothetical protein K503DRAFT_798357 [Rhizopogon vinicolor AM-OR11-026]
MSSYTPQTNLWLERSRLIGMVLGGVSYGAFLLLTIQSLVALTRRPRHGGKIADHRLVLVFYIIITFALGTISTATNIKYTEMIWIDLRNAPGGPLALIEDAWNYRLNLVALSCGHIQEWFMQALLLHRCFVIWNWTRWVVIPMTTGFITMIALSIAVQVEACTGVTFYNITIELVYLCIQVGLNVIYTLLVAHRLFTMRSQLRQIMGQYDSSTYDTVVLMVVESAMAYTIFAIIFIVAFAMENNGLSTLCFLSIGKVQGIAQLFIILRVARGRSVTNEWSTRAAAAPTTVVFSRSVSDGAEESKDEEIARPEQNSVMVLTYPASEKAAEEDLCMT